jgi:site-specific recombinase XerD
MEKALTNAELNEICLFILSKSSRYRNGTYSIFFALYNTGLRCNELLQFDRWEFLGEGRFKVKLSKKSGERIITTAQIGNEMALRILQNKPFLIENHRHLDNFIRKISKPIRTITKENCRTTHIFRYNFCRQLIEQGHDVNSVQQIISHSSPAITMAYCFNPLYCAPQKLTA